MKYSVTEYDSCVLFSVEGSLTIENLVHLENTLKQQVDEKKHILLDLSNVSFIDSFSLRFILHYSGESQSNDRLLCVINVNNEIAKLFSITELDRRVRVFGSADAALEFIRTV